MTITKTWMFHQGTTFGVRARIASFAAATLLGMGARAALIAGVPGSSAPTTRRPRR